MQPPSPQPSPVKREREPSAADFQIVLNSHKLTMKKIISTSKAPAPIGPYSQAVLIKDMLFVSGQIAIDPATGKLVTVNIIKETNQVMNNILNILKKLNPIELNLQSFLTREEKKECKYIMFY